MEPAFARRLLKGLLPIADAHLQRLDAADMHHAYRRLGSDNPASLESIYTDARMMDCSANSDHYENLQGHRELLRLAARICDKVYENLPVLQD